LKGLNEKRCSEPAELYAEKPQSVAVSLSNCTAEPINEKQLCEPQCKTLRFSAVKFLFRSVY